MKKVFSTIMAVAMATSFFFSSCSDVDAASEVSSNQTEHYKGSYGKYAQIGTEVYSALENTFGDSESARAVLDGSVKISADSTVDATSLEDLLSKNYVSKTAGDYIKKIDDAIDNNDDLDSILSAISSIEEEALANLSEADKDSVLTYAESAKATLVYFTNAEDDSVARFSFSSFKKKVKKVATAAAKGAAVGAVTGAVKGVIGGVAGGPAGILAGAGSGAAAGAVAGASTAIAEEILG